MEPRRPHEGSPARAALACARGRSTGRLVLLALAVSACASVAGCSSSAAERTDGTTVAAQRTYRVMLQGPVPMGREPLGEVLITPENAPPAAAPVVGRPADRGLIDAAPTVTAPTVAAPTDPAPTVARSTGWDTAGAGTTPPDPPPVAPGPAIPLPPGAPPAPAGPGPGTGPGSGTRPEGAAPLRELPDSPEPRGRRVARNPFSPPGTPGALRKVRPVAVPPGTALAGPVPTGRTPLRQAPGRAVRIGPVPVLPGSGRSVPIGPPVTPTSPRHVLAPGSSGEGVRELQQRLAASGWRGRVDGVFGPQTGLAVQAFQRRRGLVVDGLVGPRTWAVLRSREDLSAREPQQ